MTSPQCRCGLPVGMDSRAQIDHVLSAAHAARLPTLSAAAEPTGPNALIRPGSPAPGTAPADLPDGPGSAPPRAPDAKAVPVQRRAGAGSPGVRRSIYGAGAARGTGSRPTP